VEAALNDEARFAGDGATETPWPLIRRNFPIRLRSHVSSTKQALNAAVGDVLRLAVKCGCAPDHRTDLEISLREALANAMIHGNAYHDAKRIFLRFYGAPRTAMFILVRDEGDGFNPTDVPDPRDRERMHLNHGRGLLLMRELMDYVEYRRDGREVLLYLSCRQRPAND
jgi:serine/threonine-protein kinase RsbW